MTKGIKWDSSVYDSKYFKPETMSKKVILDTKMDKKIPRNLIPLIGEKTSL